jgi:histidyl-tRNA synthetase
LGAQDTIIAGGRYDLLMRELGGIDTPCTGWAMGPERLLLTMPDDRPKLEQQQRYFVAAIGEKYLEKIIPIRDIIQTKGNICVFGNPGDPIRQQMKRANKLAAAYAIIYGEDEDKEGVYAVKDMKTGAQKKIPVGELNSQIPQV